MECTLSGAVSQQLPKVQCHASWHFLIGPLQHPQGPALARPSQTSRCKPGQGLCQRLSRHRISRETWQKDPAKLHDQRCADYTDVDWNLLYCQVTDLHLHVCCGLHAAQETHAIMLMSGTTCSSLVSCSGIHRARVTAMPSTRVS